MHIPLTETVYKLIFGGGRRGVMHFLVGSQRGKEQIFIGAAAYVTLHIVK